MTRSPRIGGGGGCGEGEGTFLQQRDWEGGRGSGEGDKENLYAAEPAAPRPALHCPGP